MAMNTMGLGVELSLRDNFSGPARNAMRSYFDLRNAFDGGRGAFNGVADGIGRAGNAAGAAAGRGKGGGGFSSLQGMVGGVTTAVLALEGVTRAFSAFDGLTAQAGKFGKGLASAGAIMRASKEDLAQLEAAGIKAGIETQFSPTEAVEGLELLGQSGFNANEATSLLIPTLDLAAGGQISVAQAAATTSAAIKIFGLSMDQAALATDKLLRISNATALTANDLQISLGNVSRGAVVTGQSIDEMLIAIGLVKNTGVDASVASSSVSSALLAMAKNAGKFEKELGVKVTDAAGNFRPLLDIVFDSNQALSTIPSSAERTAKAMELFGRFGLTAYSAMSAQVTSGVTLDKQLLKDEDAIAGLRKQMSTAQGAAAEFKRQLLDTFEGQRTLLKGSLETLMVVTGKPLTAALRPVVEATINIVNRLIAVVQAMPEGMKTAIAKIAVVVAGLTSLAGVALAVGVAISTIAPHVAAVASAISGAWPVILGIGVALSGVALAAVALKVAIEKDLGGIGTLFGGWVADAKLAIGALAQLFASGAISGPLMDDITKAENEGVLNFVTNVYTAVGRIKNFLSGIGDGFSAQIEKLEPIFSAFRQSIEGLAAEFGGLTQSMDPAATGAAYDAAGEKGRSFGTVIANAAGIAVRVLTGIIDVVTGIVQKWESFKGAVSPITDIFSSLGSEVGDIAAELAGASTAGEGFVYIGKFIGMVFSNLVSVVAAAAQIVIGQIRGIANIFGGVIEIIKGIITGDWAMVWNGFKRIVYGAITFVISALAGVLQAVGAVVDALGRVVGEDLGVAKFIADARKQLDSDIKLSMGLTKHPGETPPGEVAPGPPVVEPPPPPAEDELFGTVASEQAATRDSELFATMDALRAGADKKPPVEVHFTATLEVDGTQLASVQADQQADDDNRSYVSTNP